MLVYRSFAVALLCLAVGTITSSSLHADEKDDLIKKDTAALQGTWLLESAERRGGQTFPQKFVENFKFIFDGNKLTIVMPGSELKSTYTLDPTKKPKHIDVKTGNGIVSPAIYSIEKDTLKVVLDEEDKTRATGFVTKKGSTHMSFTFKRKKK
jgi:uncharacterized protein (TIGR03067 family)